MALTAAVELSDIRVSAPHSWRVRVTLSNPDASAIRLSTATLSAQVSFEVHDGAGARVPLGPPPIPPADPAGAVVTIEAGGSLTLDYAGHELFADAPAPGRYRLRFHGGVPEVAGAWSGELVSEWVEFEVVSRR